MNFSEINIFLMSVIWYVLKKKSSLGELFDETTRSPLHSYRQY